MQSARENAASVIYKNKIWITGGFVYGLRKWLNTSEYILPNGKSLAGPDLPVLMQSHAAVNVNETHTIITGGTLLYILGQ